MSWVGASLTLAPMAHALAAVLAMAAFGWSAWRRGIPWRLGVDAAFALLTGAWAGSWAAMVLLTRLFPAGWDAPGGPVGHSSLGALAGGMLTVAFLLRCHSRAGAARGAILDALAPAMALGEAAARLACLSRGCCHGRPVQGLPWAVTYATDDACLYPGLPVHPAPAYLAIGLFLFGAWLLVRASREVRPVGRWLAVYLVGYAVLRGLVEGFRGDVQPAWLGLRLNQWIVLAGGMWGWFQLGRERAAARASASHTAFRSVGAAGGRLPT